MKNKSSLLAGLIVLVIVGGLVVHRLREDEPSPENTGTNLAPQVVTTTLDGQTWRLADQRGKVVLIDFWATWCGPCIMAMPHMRQVYERFRSNPDFLMVGVSLDDRPEDVRAFLQRQELPWIQLYDPAQPFARAFRVSAIPSVWVIGRDGRIAGGYLDGPAIESTVAAELARK